MLLKKLAIFGIACVLIVSFGMIQGCSENDKVVEPVVQEQSDIPVDVQQQLAQAEQYERLIAVMDPYINQSASGEYVFDEAGFAATQASLPVDDQTVIIQLKEGIPVVNQKLQDLIESDIAAKVWFRWYWWGYKECYSELSAEYMLDAMQFSMWGLAIYPAAKWLHYHFGYFCIYHTWAGGVWANL